MNDNRRKLMGYLTLAGLAPVLLWWLGGCSKARNPWDEVEGGSTHVLVSFPPLYCFTRGVAGNDAKVLSLLAMTGPHEHQPGADDAQVAEDADLFLVNGLELDDFVTNVANTSRNKKLKIVKVAEKAIPKSKRLPLGKQEHEEHADHKHGEWDPHVWLGPEQAMLMVKEIAVALKEADPQHAAGYDERAAAYIKKLESLQAEGKKLLEGKKNKKLIATHESLGYFCEAFGLKMVGSIMPQPGIPADLREMAMLTDLCVQQNVRVIATEPQYQAKDAETLRQSVDKRGQKIAIVKVDPLETVEKREQLTPDYYFDVMRQNLKNLAEQMQ
jgi:ABC-type Zn uptake system ZnuABC Zn-binding protein ZnuA